MADEMIGGMGDTTGRAGASSDSTQNHPAPAPGAQEGAPHGAPSPVPDFSKAKQDFAKILSEVKLPEHHDFRASGDAKPKQFEFKSALEDLEKPIPKPAADQPEGIAPTQKPDGDADIAAVHTLKQDLQHIVHDQKISYVRAVALEADKHHSTQDAPRPAAPRARSHATSIIAAALGLLFVGGAALGGVYLAQVMNATPIPQQQSDSLVFAEQSVPFNISGISASDLKNQLAQIRSTSHGSLGSITRLIPVVVASSTSTSAPASLATFLAAIGAQPPADLMRALSDQFFVGLHTVDTNAPFFVIPVSDYDRAFSGMLTWESTIDSDLSPFFASVPQYVTGPDGIPTTRTFADVVMRNYDVRALKNDAGQIVLYYSFPTRNILVIAESPYTFTEVLTRLQAQRRI